MPQQCHWQSFALTFLSIAFSSESYFRGDRKLIALDLTPEGRTDEVVEGVRRANQLAVQNLFF